MFEQTPEQKKAVQDATGFVPGGQNTTPVFSTQNLTPATPINLPQAPTITSPEEMQGGIDGSLATLTSAIESLNAPSQAEQDQGKFRTEILDSLGRLSGKQARTTELENQAGLPGLNKQLLDVSNQLQGLQKEALAIPLQIQEQFAGTGATRGGVEPIQASRLRQNAIKSLGLSAIGQTLQGNIALARQNVDRAIDLEFEPEEKRLEYISKLYEFNQQDLTRSDKKRSERVQVLLDERKRILDDQKLNKSEIYNIGLTAQKYGADSGTVQNIFTAKTREEAVAAAGKYLTDPKAKLEMKNLELDALFKKAQTEKLYADAAKTRAEAANVGKPTAAEIKELEKQRKEEEKAMKDAKAAIPVVQNKISQIDSIVNSPALSSVVGPNPLTRSQPGIGNLFKAVTVFGAPAAIAGSYRRFTGESQNLIANVEQLTSKEFIDSLLSAKAQGATFGALNESEQRALEAAASKIGTWRIQEDGKTLGFNASESDFKKEMETIRKSTNLVLTRLQGDALVSDERTLVDRFFEDQAPILTGMSYYSTP